MKTPVTRAKEFLNILRKVHNKAFPNRQPLVSIGIGKSSRRSTELYTEAQKERDIFRAFHEQVT